MLVSSLLSMMREKVRPAFLLCRRGMFENRASRSPVNATTNFRKIRFDNTRNYIKHHNNPLPYHSRPYYTVQVLTVTSTKQHHFGDEQNRTKSVLDSLLCKGKSRATLPQESLGFERDKIKRIQYYSASTHLRQA